MYTVKLQDARSNMISLVGRKSAYLSELLNSGFNVPKGFVVTSKAFEDFINIIKDKIEEKLASVNLNRIEELEKRSTEVKNLILNTEMPEEIAKEVLSTFDELDSRYVAVRSTVASPLSGPSFAGEYDTYLFVSRDDLIDSIKRAWASYFNVRAIAYRLSTRDSSPIAILVQSMVNPKSAGTALTIHPITEESDYVFIESSWGLGQAVTKGMVTPDQIIISKSIRKIISKRYSEKHLMLTYDFLDKKLKTINLVGSEISTKPSITDSDAVKIANYAIALENFYKRAVNIEWAIDENNELYILEIRGIRKTYSSDY
jgi:phosphoenolpyruvate synthase/pyruvate phosphate dikinase